MLLVIAPTLQDAGELLNRLIDDLRAEDLACERTNPNELQPGINGRGGAEQVGEHGTQRPRSPPIVRSARPLGAQLATPTNTLSTLRGFTAPKRRPSPT